MKAGHTQFNVNDRLVIKNCIDEDEELNGLTGSLPHPFGCFPEGDVGVYLDNVHESYGGIINLNIDQIASISDYALLSQLQFKHHSRDLIIATHSILEQSIVITDNTKHFSWMNEKVMSPDELVVHASNELI